MKNPSALIAGELSSQPSSKRRKLDDLPDSLTANRMIELIGRGKANVATMAALARVIQADGLHKPALAAIAGLGNEGKHESNCERDLLSIAKGLWGFNIEPYEISLCLQVL